MHSVRASDVTNAPAAAAPVEQIIEHGGGLTEREAALARSTLRSGSDELCASGATLSGSSAPAAREVEHEEPAAKRQRCLGTEVAWV